MEVGRRTVGARQVHPPGACARPRSAGEGAAAAPHAPALAAMPRALADDLALSPRALRIARTDSARESAGAARPALEARVVAWLQMHTGADVAARAQEVGDALAEGEVLCSLVNALAGRRVCVPLPPPGGGADCSVTDSVRRLHNASSFLEGCRLVLGVDERELCSAEQVANGDDPLPLLSLLATLMEKFPRARRRVRPHAGEVDDDRAHPVFQRLANVA